MSLAQLKKMSARQRRDDELDERVRRYSEPVVVTPTAPTLRRLMISINPHGVVGLPLPECFLRPSQRQARPAVGSPEAEVAMAAAWEEWRRLYGSGA
jgi:hypothetical protein